MAATWDAKFELHQPLYLVHTRSEDARDCIEESGVVVRPYGTAYLVASDLAPQLIDILTENGFIVAN